MFERVNTFFNRGSIINAIEVVEVSGNTQYHLTKTKITKGELFIIEGFTSNSIEALQEKLTDKEYVHLIINTTSVLTKLVNDATSSTDAIVNSAFPNIDFSKFNYELYRQGKSSVVCVCRKSVVKEILNAFESNKIPISEVALGVSKISTLTKVLGAPELALRNYKLEVSEELDVDSISPEDYPEKVAYSLGDMEISNNQALGFSNILHSLGSNSKLSGNITDLNDMLENHLFNRRFFHYIFRGILGFLLVLLLANFLMFNAYYSMNTELNMQSLNNSSIAEQLSTLRTSIERKEAQVKSLYGSESSRVSYFLDDIADGIPGDISLNEIKYQPYQGSIRNSKPIKYDVNTMLIQGETSNRDRFNNWVAYLEAKNYIKRVEILNFSYLNKNVSEFSLKIILEDEAR